MASNSTGIWNLEVHSHEHAHLVGAEHEARRSEHEAPGPFESGVSGVSELGVSCSIARRVLVCERSFAGHAPISAAKS